MKLTLLLCLAGFSANCAEILPLPQKFVRAIHQVETGGRTGAIKGDQNRALGPLQIHKAYWQDAVSYDKTIGGRYEDCADLAYSVRVMTAYLNRYQKTAIQKNDFQTLARVHNGGLNGAKKAATNGYWAKVAGNL
jgi:hypothetical protein